MKIKQVKVTAISIATMGLVLAACGGSSSSASSSATTAGSSPTTQASLESASVSVIPNFDGDAPLFEMLSQGAFKAQGVNLSLTNVESGSALVTSIETGVADYTQAPITVLASAIAHGAPITMFAPAQPFGGFQLESKAGSKYTTIQSLKGQKIGISAAGSVTAQLAAYINAKYNLGATLVPVGANGQPSALESGELPAVVESSPSSYTLVSTGKAQVIVNFSTTIQTLQAWAASTSFLKSHQALTAKILKAWYGAMKSYASNSTIGEHEFLTKYHEPPAVASKQYQYTVKAAPLTASLTTADIQNAYSLLNAGGTVSGLPPVNSLVTSQFTSLAG